MQQSAQLAPDTALREVDNPYFGPTSPAEHRRILAVANLRNDPLGQMYHRGQLGPIVIGADDKSEAFARYRAGRLWQADYEAAGIGRIKSQDTTIEPVDGGGGASHQRFGVTDRQVQAMRRLRHWQKLLGSDGWRLTVTVLGDKRSVREATQVLYGEASKAKMTYAGHRFRECLDALAELMGLTT